MPAARKHESAAAKQRAYRQRQAAMRNDKPLRIERPPVRYFGGKWRIAPWILQYFPPHVAYVEPFCGGASMLFRKDPSQLEAINDLNSDIVNFFSVLRSAPGDLIKNIELTPYSREEHTLAHIREGDPLERARRFYVRSRQSFNSGEAVHSTGWRFQTDDSRGSSCIDEFNNVTFLWEASRRLKTVQIECDDALKIIKRFDKPSTLFYVDPPYLFSTRYSNEARYSHEMSDGQHEALSELLHQVQGMVILSGYKSALYDQLYKGWTVFSKETKTNANHSATEYLWLSPNATRVETLPMFKYLENEQ